MRWGALEDNARRRTLLQARSTTLRLHMHLQLAALERPLGIAARVANAAAWAARHPWWVAAPLAAFVAFKPGKVLSWSLRAFAAVRAIRQVRAMLSR